MKAWLEVALTDRHGRVVQRRREHNAVMESGAQLIADLFAGFGDGITHMGVGTNGLAPDDVAISALANEADGDVPALTGDTTAPIPGTAFSTTVIPEKRVVRLRVRGTLPDDAAVGTIREAGLLSVSDDETVLYNRVVFAPISKGDDHELTLFWEIDFPFGDLQWLS